MSEELSGLKKLLNTYHGFAVRGPNQDLDSGEMKTAARVKKAVINTLASLQALGKIDDSLRKKILSVVEKQDITQASTADRLEAVIEQL